MGVRGCFALLALAGGCAPDAVFYTCTTDAECGGGMCVGGSCTTAPTTPTGCTSNAQCGVGMICSVGSCVPLMAPNPDASVPRESCATAELAVQRPIPTIIFIVDRSGSMDNDFGSGSRWGVLRDTLLNVPGGLIASLQSTVRFGVVMYTGTDSSCANLITINPSLNNHAAIAPQYHMYEPESDTPTGDSIDAILNQLPTMVPPEAATEETIFILATDGEPDTCEDGSDQAGGRREALEAVQRAHAQGIRTYVISVGDDVGQDHLQAVANAGLGVAPGAADAQFWVANDTTGLNTALSTIVRGEVSCTLNLEGEIMPEQACDGTVLLDGAPLACNDANGWRPVDSTHIEIMGQSCERLQQGGSQVRAEFPCGIIVY